VWLSPALSSLSMRMRWLQTEYLLKGIFLGLPNESQVQGDFLRKGALALLGIRPARGL
jgi:hypothetical protein